MEHSAAAGTLGTGGIHDGAGVALVGNHEQQLIVGVFQGAFLHSRKGLVFGQELQGTLAAHAADRDDERDAGARHVDPHLAAERLLDLGPGVGGDDGKQNGFFALFQAEGGQHFLHGRAGTHGAEADTDTVALVQGQERVRGAAVGDGDQPVKGICHS